MPWSIRGPRACIHKSGRRKVQGRGARAHRVGPWRWRMRKIRTRRHRCEQDVSWSRVPGDQNNGSRLARFANDRPGPPRNSGPLAHERAAARPVVLEVDGDLQPRRRRSPCIGRAAIAVMVANPRAIKSSPAPSAALEDRPGRPPWPCATSRAHAVRRLATASPAHCWNCAGSPAHRGPGRRAHPRTQPARSRCRPWRRPRPGGQQRYRGQRPPSRTAHRAPPAQAGRN